MTKYKLTYFDAKGRVEPIRMMFKAANVEFEDYRIQWEKFLEAKPTLQFGYLPVLEVDDGKFVLSESTAIMRYLAKQFGLNGKDEFEEARADMMVTALTEMTMTLMSLGAQKDPVKKEEEHKKFIEKIPTFLANIEKLFKENNGGKEEGFYVGNSMTYADIVAYYLFSTMLTRRPEALDKRPALKAHVNMMGEVKEIKAWCETRPVTEH